MRILVLGCIVRVPLGGRAWADLHYLLGLRDLGHDVFFLEQSGEWPSCYDPARHVVDADPTYGLSFLTAAFRRHRLEERWAYHDAHSHGWIGPVANRVHELVTTADVVLNLAGTNSLAPWFTEIPVRILVDKDPCFTQARHLQDADARQRAAAHTSFFTLGTNFGKESCTIPDDGLGWRPTRHPIHLRSWRRTSSTATVSQPARYTTVMQWERYPGIRHGDREFGMKSHSFQHFLDLPSRTSARLELALGTPTAPRDELRAKGWLLRDPLEVTRTPGTYRRYIAGSRGELAVAKEGYVASRSGWFSERSGAYLASGRPVILQDTGFSDWLPVGEGLLAFSTVEEAARALHEVDNAHRRHAKAALDLAECHFDSGVVLRGILDGAHASRAALNPGDSRKAG